MFLIDIEWFFTFETLQKQKHLTISATQKYVEAILYINASAATATAEKTTTAAINRDDKITYLQSLE